LYIYILDNFNFILVTGNRSIGCKYVIFIGYESRTWNLAIYLRPECSLSSLSPLICFLDNLIENIVLVHCAGHQVCWFVRKRQIWNFIFVFGLEGLL